MASVTIVSNHLKEIAANEDASEESLIKDWKELWDYGINDDIIIIDTEFLAEDEEYGGYQCYLDPKLVVDEAVFSVMELFNIQLDKLLQSGKTVVGILSGSRILKDKPNDTISFDNYHWLPFVDGFHRSGQSYTSPVRMLPDPARVKCDLETEGLDKYFLNAGWSNISIDLDATEIEEYEIVGHYDVNTEHADEGYDYPAGIIVESWRDTEGELIEPEGKLVLLPKPFSLKIDVRDWFTSLIEVGASFSPNTAGYDQLHRIIGRSDSEPLQRIFRICERLPEVERQLQNRYNDRSSLEINDEYDLQDLLHSLLMLYFNDVRAEEWAPSYGGTSPRIDFLIKRETIAVELKVARSGRVNSDIKEELAIDKEHYRTHPDCETLVCYVYDPEYVMDNPVGFEEDLSESIDDLTTEVIVSSSNRF